MTRQDLKDEIQKLAPSEYTGDFRSHLSSLLRDYSELINSFDGKEEFEEWGSICSLIKKLSEAIKESVKRVYQGRHSSAYSLLRKHLNEIPEMYGLYAVFKTDTIFFRMRVFDENSSENPSYKGLFHIPFDKRGIVKTERYSAPGYPCLYLGISSYICWEEMNRPNLHKCYVSCLKTNESFRTINLSLPTDDDWNNDNSLIGYLVRFPLIIANMIAVKNHNDVFKPEYIIPQLIMEWIIEKINSSKELKKPIGVFYTSVHVKDGFNYPSYVFNNLALPAQSPFNGKYSKELCSLFSISEPTSDEIERAKGTYSSVDNILLPPKNPDKKEMQLYKYRISTFGIMEKMLLKEDGDYPMRSMIDN